MAMQVDNGRYGKIAVASVCLMKLESFEVSGAWIEVGCCQKRAPPADQVEQPHHVDVDAIKAKQIVR